MSATQLIRRAPIVRAPAFALRRRRTEFIERYLRIDTVSLPAEIARHGCFDDDVHYEAMDYALLRRFLRPMHLGAEDVVYDIGCGLGRFLCVLARRDVAGVVGIELSSALADGARRNLARLRGRRAPAEVRTEDAATADYDDGTAFILYNPFGPETLATVLDRIRASMTRRPRPVRLAYFHPVHEGVLAGCPWLECVGRDRSPWFRPCASYWVARPIEAS